MRKTLYEYSSYPNASGHGLDLVAENAQGETEFFEVKASLGPAAPSLSDAQKNMRAFVISRLDRAAQGGRFWSRIPPAMMNDAQALLDGIRLGDIKVTGSVIRVTNLGTPPPMINVKPWQ